MAEVNGESLMPMLDGGLRLEEIDVVLFIAKNDVDNLKIVVFE